MHGELKSNFCNFLGPTILAGPPRSAPQRYTDDGRRYDAEIYRLIIIIVTLSYSVLLGEFD